MFPYKNYYTQIITNFSIYQNNMSKTPQIETSWLEALKDEFEKPYFPEIKKAIVNDINDGKVLYPPMDKVFNAFNHTPFDQVKVVILWQDPYHGPNQAHWLSFSVADGIPQPPSLKNIFKEIHADLGLTPPPPGTPLEKGRFESGNLEPWAKQWVLMLNAILTVQKAIPASHSKIGWETFTDAVIKKISDEKMGVIFLLWGNFARGKVSLIDTTKHSVLESPHPSTFSAHNGFFWCKHFSKTNELLKEMGKEEIDWRI